MCEVVDYIIRFLLKGNDALAARVGYTADVAQFSRYSVVIVPSEFFGESLFGKPCSEPQLPLAEIAGVPILFGAPRIERLGDTLVVYADVVASAFFLLSRYEETLFPTEHRDAHGRFLGRESLLGRAGLLHRPLVDEYADLLLDWLDEAGCHTVRQSPTIAEIYLTHDVDVVERYRHWRGFLGGVVRNLFSPSGLRRICGSLQSLQNDPAFTFPWIAAQDAKIERAHKLYFIKSAVKQAALDYPNYNLRGKDFRYLLSFLQKNGGEIGLHTSYFSGENPEFVPHEKSKLEASLGFPITQNRWHYLRTLQPSDFRALVVAGITDDFTVGYADLAGFRLGTSRPVRWIDPMTREVTNLMLHPLTVMDGTLSNADYMGLPEEEAYNCVSTLISVVKKHGGEVVLLWHNTSFADGTYHRSLYPKVINMLQLMR